MRLLYRKHIFYLRLSFVTFGPGSKILHKRYWWLSEKTPLFAKITCNIILCTVHVVGLYPNIPHDEGLSDLRKQLNLRRDFNTSRSWGNRTSRTKVFLKNNILTLKEKTLKQKCDTAISTEFALPYSILLMAGLEEEI